MVADRFLTGICKITSAVSRGQNLLADSVLMLHKNYMSPFRRRSYGCHHAGCACARHNHIFHTFLLFSRTALSGTADFISHIYFNNSKAGCVFFPDLQLLHPPCSEEISECQTWRAPMSVPPENKQHKAVLWDRQRSVRWKIPEQRLPPP